MTRSRCSWLVLVLALMLAWPSNFLIPPRADGARTRSAARAHSSVRMEAPSEARFLPACAAALAALMMALSLGVDATPPGVRREPQETKVSSDWAQMECKKDVVAELQTCHLQMDAERQQMEAERSKFQEDLQEASQLATDHATQRSLLEEQLKDLQAKMDSSTAQLTELTAQLDTEREARQQLDVENSRLQASCAESEAQVQRCKGELEAARKGTLEAETSQLAELQRSRASLEQERQQLVASQAELQLEKNHQAAEKLELEAMRKSLEEKDPHLQQAVSELSKLRVALTSAQPELQSLLSQLATSELFKVESSPPAAAVPGSAVGPARRSYARRSVVPVAAPAADKESDEEMFRMSVTLRRVRKVSETSK